MDEVLKKFETTIILKESKDFTELYKNWGKLGNQEDRRKQLLDVQKRDRCSKIDELRGLLDHAVNEEDNVFQIDSNEKAYYKPSVFVSGLHEPNYTYRNVLMMSEWLIEKPEDFNENWYVTPCPKATRTVVVASKGSTKCYSKHGNLLLECHTSLPGGNHTDPQFRTKWCILDCFFYEKNKTMYVLDLLAWNNQPMTDGETEFRHYWLKTKLLELPELTLISKYNRIKFILLPMVECTTEKFNGFMKTYPHFQKFMPILDGLLFYHKKVHYISGETPLVGWLYPYMVPEVLGSDIEINEAYMMGMPAGYTNQAEFIHDFEMKSKKKTQKKRYSSSAMDTTDINTAKSQSKCKSTCNEIEETRISGSEGADACTMDYYNDMETTVMKLLD